MTSSDFIRWCYDGNAELIEQELARGNEHYKDVQFSTGDSLLHIACSRGHHRVVAVLLEHGARTETLDGMGRTPLWVAVERGHPECALALIGADANLEAKRPYFFGGAHSSDFLLHRAIQMGLDVRVIRAMVLRVRDVNAADNGGRTPLLMAAYFKHVPAIHVLLEHGARVSYQNTRRCPFTQTFTPLQALCYNSFGGIPRLLDRTACTPRTIVGAARALLAAGARVNARGRNGVTALFYAVETRYERLVRLLLNNGADTSVVTADTGDSALHLAVRGNNPGMVLMLLQAGADEAVENRSREFAIDLALARRSYVLRHSRFYGFKLILRVLADEGVRPRVSDTVDTPIELYQQTEELISARGDQFENATGNPRLAQRIAEARAYLGGRQATPAWKKTTLHGCSVCMREGYDDADDDDGETMAKRGKEGPGAEDEGKKREGLQGKETRMREGVVLDCGHRFCKECILEWVKISATCPLCRAPFDKHQ